MSTYNKITEEAAGYKHPEVFFAFSQQQYEDGKAQMPAGEKIYKGFGGAFGTCKGFEAMDAYYDALKERIQRECTPAEVYNYEYDNHECAYSHDNSVAVEIAQSYFPDYEFPKYGKISIKNN
jgi:hypothetical protein